MPQRNLDKLFSPDSICLIGASDDVTKVSGKPLDYLVRHHFAGSIFVVNPNRATVQGHRTFKSVTQVPETIDVALIMVPAAFVPVAVQQCEQAGVGSVVILTSGFDEAQDGEQATMELRAIQKRGNVGIIGPNCEGLWNLQAPMVLTLGSIANQPQLLSGPVAVISQSGSIGAGLVRNLQDMGVGCDHFISTGNEVDLGVVDFIDHLSGIAQPPEVILLFIEGLRDGHRLVEVVRRARQRGIVVVALKSGQSEAGKIATASHTGKIATQADLYSDVFLQAGVIEVTSLLNLARAALAVLGGKPVRTSSASGGIGVLGLSGGSRALIVDAAFALDVPLATFSRETEAKIAEMIPSYGVAANPTDITAQVLGSPEMFETVLRVIADDEGTEALLVQFSNSGARALGAMSSVLQKVREETGKPIVASMLGDESGKELRGDFFARGLHFASGPDEAVQTLRWAYEASEVAEEVSSDGPLIVAAGVDHEDSLSTHASQEAFIRMAGVQVPRSSVLPWASPVELPQSLAFPVAVKALPTAVAHKAEIGAVEIGLMTELDFENAVTRLRGLELPGEGLLVQEMVPPGLELLVSMRTDNDFGPVLTVGAGGFLVELVQDTVNVSLPCTLLDIRNALTRLRIAPALQGYRTISRRDVSALEAAVCALGNQYAALEEGPIEIEINPLIVLESGKGVFAVDVLVQSR